MRAIVVSLLLLTALPQADAQPTAKLWRIGYLDQGSAVGNKLYLEAFRQGLRNLGARLASAFSGIRPTRYISRP